ncbi:MAG: hypothetical protein ABSD44_06180 [Terracidiphilus sp.]
MLHGKVVYAVVFSGTGFASDAVGVALESGGYGADTVKLRETDGAAV